MQLLRNGLMQATDSALSFGVASVYWGNAANRGGQGLFADWHVSGSRTASIARAQPAKTKEAREVVAAGTAYSADTRRGYFVYRQRALGKRFRGRFPEGDRIPAHRGFKAINAPHRLLGQESG